MSSWRKRRSKGFSPFLVSDEAAKALLVQRLKLSKAGAGYLHFPADEPAFDDEYFAQLTAEKLVTKMRGTRPYAEWVQTRPRNEALDCWKYALAALRLSGIDLSLRAKARAVDAEKPAKTPPTTAARTPKPPILGW